MAQHDNGRPSDAPGGAWQREQQDQSSSGRFGSQPGQQGGHHEAGSTGHYDQYDQNRAQQGDGWRGRQGPAAGGWRPAMHERDRSWNELGGQGSAGRQASDNDYGNGGITESGNFGNHAVGRGDSYGTMSGQHSDGLGGHYDAGGQGNQRFDTYRRGYDARSDSTGGYGSSNFGPDRDPGDDWNTRQAWRDEPRYRGDPAPGGNERRRSTWGRSPTAGRPGNPDWHGLPVEDAHRAGHADAGRFAQGQRGQSYHDPDYHQWRYEQIQRLDRDYEEWRRHRYQRFADEFDAWRSNRAGQASQPQYSESDSSSVQVEPTKPETTQASDKSEGGPSSSGSRAT
jgi:hypothetical protein